MTKQTIEVLAALLTDPQTKYYGFELSRITQLTSGTMYPILARLEMQGWVVSFWEDPQEHEAQGRPRRRYYRLTSNGAEQARQVVDVERRRQAQPYEKVRPTWGSA
jgi:DNA-binding PadR family transcriptional regulator